MGAFSLILLFFVPSHLTFSFSSIIIQVSEQTTIAYRRWRVARIIKKDKTMSQMIEVYTVAEGAMKGVNIKEMKTGAAKRAILLLRDYAEEAEKLKPAKGTSKYEALKNKFWRAMETGYKIVIFNRRNLEYQEDFSLTGLVREIYSEDPSANATVKEWMDMLKRVYGLRDLWFTTLVYRIGAYSYYSVRVEPMFDETQLED